MIAIQVVVPMVALLRPPPQKFGFQMYSGLGGVTVSVINDEGVAEELNDVEQIVGKLRPDIDWLQIVPESVCTAVPDAAGVRVEQAGRERTVECN